MTDYSKYNQYLTQSDITKLNTKVQRYKDKNYTQTMIDEKLVNLIATIKKRKEFRQKHYAETRKSCFQCDVCGVSVDKYYRKKHLQTISHKEKNGEL